MMKRLLYLLCVLCLTTALHAQESNIERKMRDAFMYLDPRVLYADSLLSTTIMAEFHAGNYEEVLKYTSSYFLCRKIMVGHTYSFLSEEERNEVNLLVEGDPVFHHIMSSIIYTDNSDVLGEVYDYILFVKQLQLRIQQQFNFSLQHNTDQQLWKEYERYRKLRQQFANSHPSSTVNRDSLQNEISKLGRILAQESDYSIQEDMVSWQEVQKNLNLVSAAIEFVKFHIFKGDEITHLNVYAALVLTPLANAPTLIVMTTEKFLTYWEPTNHGDLYDVKKYGNGLSQFVWLKVLNFLDQNDIETIYFAPTGVLHNMALESLPYSKKTLMSEQYNMVRLTSTRQLLHEHNPQPTKTVSIYGNLAYRISEETMQQNAKTRSVVAPLPWSVLETNEISKVLESQAYTIQTYTQHQGTEEEIKAMDGKSPSILHIATHGFFNRQINDDVMGQSGLIMTYGARAWEGKSVPTNMEDGVLTATEIATLDLSGTDLVVLSACNTARGEIDREGVWGLQRAFKQAGVNTIVMSLWQVDDEATSLLMRYFYEELVKQRQAYVDLVARAPSLAKYKLGYTARALSVAQNRLRKKSKYASPYYWAGFVAIE